MTAWASTAWATGAWATGAWATGSGSSGGAPSTDDAPSNLTIVHTIHSDDAVLTASDEADGYPVENVQNVLRSKAWRSGGLSGSPTTRIDGTWEDGLAYGAGFFGLFNHLLYGCTGHLVLYPNADWTGTPEYDSGPFTIGTSLPVAQTWGQAYNTAEDADLGYFDQPLGLWFPMVYCASFSFSISGTPTTRKGASLDYYHIGRLVLGPFYEFARNADFRPALSAPSNTGYGRTGGGSNARARGAKWKKLQCSMKTVSDDDQAAMVALMDWMADGRDGVLALFPDDTGWKGRAYLQNGCFTADDAFVLDEVFGSRTLTFESN